MSTTNICRMGALATILPLLAGCALWPDADTGHLTTAAEFSARYTTEEGSHSYAIKTYNAFDDILTSDDAFERAATYGLYGLAVATGVRTAGSNSKASIKSFVLAGAGILGLREVVKPQDQQKVFEGAKKGISCALKLDEEIKQAGKALGKRNEPVSMQETGALESRTTTARQFIHIATISPEIYLLKANDPPSVAIEKYRLQQYKLNLDLGLQAAADLIQAVLTADTIENRALALAGAIDDIRDSVGHQLRTLIDPTAVTAAVQKRFSDTAGQIAQARAAAAQYQRTIQSPPALSTPDAMHALESTTDTAGGISELLAITEPVVSSYQTCLQFLYTIPPASPPPALAP